MTKMFAVIKTDLAGVIDLPGLEKQIMCLLGFRAAVGAELGFEG